MCLCLVMAGVTGGFLGANARAAEPHAADGNDARTLMRKGIALQREASWSASIAALEKARALGLLAPAERVECAFYLAAAYVAVGSDGAARRELTAVLEAQPSFEPPPFTPPKVATMLGEVSRELGQRAELEARPPRRVPANGAALTPGFELGFESRRAHPPIYGVVRYRMRGDAVFREVPLSSREKNATGLVAEVHPEKGGVLEYYADALSASGVLHAGSAEHPLELPIAQADVDATKNARQLRGTSPLVWLAVPLGIVAGAALGLGLYYGLPPR